MAGRRLEAETDRLYRLPLAEFTPARNALAKAGGAAVRGLAKPTVPAWAVNQLYWRDRQTYDALIRASEAQRRTHKAVLAGRAGDLRATGKAHDEAIERALKAALAILTGEGHPVTDATRQGILTTLRALPAEEPPGRLTGTLQPGGFEMLAGLTVAGAPRRSAKAAPARTAKAAPGATGARAGDAARAKAVARARAEREEAARKLRQAEQVARREEFEAARAAREAEKAERKGVEARAAYEAAGEALEEAEALVPALGRAREASARRAREASAALEAARAALDAAEDQLTKL